MSFINNIIKSNKKTHLLLITSVLAFLFISMFCFDMLFGAQANNVQSYNSGDAIVFNNEIYVGSVNTKKLELFKQEGSELVKKYTLSARDSHWNDFYGFTFNVENDILYAYAVNGRYLYKYNLSDISQPIIAQRVKDNSWDWFMNVRKFGDNVATIGTKGVKVWSHDMKVINSYENKDKSNKITFSKGGELVFDIKTDHDFDKENDFVKIIDGQSQKLLTSPQIVFTFDRNRRFYFEPSKDLVYLIGDRVLKQVNLRNGQVDDFRHISSEGFSVDGIPGSDHFYFSDGVGIVKMNHNMEPVSWEYAYKFGMPSSYAMGMKVLEQNNKEQLVVFNHESIVVLDNNFKLVSAYKSQVDDSSFDEQADSQALNMWLSKTKGAENSLINITGVGFSIYEKVKVSFVLDGKEIGKIDTVTDERGEFEVLTAVPELPYSAKHPATIDIRATDQVSYLSYSVSFVVE